MFIPPSPRSVAVPVLAMLLLVGSPGRAAETTSPDKPSTVGAMLTAVADAAPTTPAETHALQTKLQSHWASKRVTVDAGLIIQVVTEGGGLKLIAFPPDETAGPFAVRQALSHVTLAPSDEAAGRKLVPGDRYVASGTVASLSAQFNGRTEDGKAVVRLNLTLKDATIAATTIKPKKQKAATRRAAN